jgi:hypothetical protein
MIGRSDTAVRVSPRWTIFSLLRGVSTGAPNLRPPRKEAPRAAAAATASPVRKRRIRPPGACRSRLNHKCYRNRFGDTGRVGAAVRRRAAGLAFPQGTFADAGEGAARQFRRSAPSSRSAVASEHRTDGRRFDDLDVHVELPRTHRDELPIRLELEGYRGRRLIEDLERHDTARHQHCFDRHEVSRSVVTLQRLTVEVRVVRARRQAHAHDIRLRTDVEIRVSGPLNVEITSQPVGIPARLRDERQVERARARALRFRCSVRAAPSGEHRTLKYADTE